jgi:hypothetical protein
MTTSTIKTPIVSITGILLFLGLLGLIVIKMDSQTPQAKRPTQDAEIPTCESKATVEGLKAAVRNAPTNKIVNLELLAVKDAKELSWDSKDQTRRCTATFFLNSGAEEVSYRIFWIDRSKGQFIIEIELA